MFAESLQVSYEKCFSKLSMMLSIFFSFKRVLLSFIFLLKYVIGNPMFIDHKHRFYNPILLR